ncbi:Sphingosine-1-phosphate lyase [Nakaseomyces bracarensis]|uniref:sphinganine-1-phosphate aldolase n=1 Tax=Nakaseomyces bracarensis TaxID=273131 RepID=A0ABR4NSI9_9SACH
MDEFIEQAKLLGEQLVLEAQVYFQTTPWYNIIKDYLFVLFFYKLLNRIYVHLRGHGLFGSIAKLYNDVSSWTFQQLLGSFLMRGTVEREVNKALSGLEAELIKNDDKIMDFGELPEQGLSSQKINDELDKLKEVLPHTSWEEGKVSGAVYHGGTDLIKLQSQAFEKFCVANQLHPDVFPAVRKMEAEVVAMTLKAFNAPTDTGCGTTTSGGTESLLLACLSAKMYAYHHRGITKPEMVIPVTAHAGFDKAGYYFGIKIHHVDLDPVTYKVDLKKLERLINKNTVLIAGSAPNFPHGIADDIEGLGKIATKHKIPLHVDCCLGSFIVAFMSKAGFEMPSFDFRVPGVTSISCDTHKYGFAPKGSSVIMYRNSDLRMHQYYVDSKWTGGLYGSPTLAGSRPGALVVGCWATMIHMGESGYTDSCKQIVGTARKLKAHIREKIPELEILGDPQLSVLSFRSDKFNIYDLADKLSKKGWHLNALQKPAALHLAITTLSVPTIDTFIEVLTETVHEMANNPASQAKSAESTSALYGVAGSIKTSGVADKLIVGFLDTLYKLKPRNKE